MSRNAEPNLFSGSFFIFYLLYTKKKRKEKKVDNKRSQWRLLQTVVVSVIQDTVLQLLDFCFPSKFSNKNFFHFIFFNLNLNGLSISSYHSHSYVSQKILAYVFKMYNIISNRSWRTCKKSVDDDDPIWPLGLFFIPP